MFREAAGPTGQMVGGRLREKADLQWHRSIQLGRLKQTIERIVGNRDGIFMTRSMRRLPAMQRRGTEGMRSMVGVPWASQHAAPPESPEQRELARTGTTAGTSAGL